MDPRYLHPAKLNYAACQGPATGGKDLLIAIVALFGKQEMASRQPARLRTEFLAMLQASGYRCRGGSGICLICAAPEGASGVIGAHFPTASAVG